MANDTDMFDTDTQAKGGRSGGKTGTGGGGMDEGMNAIGIADENSPGGTLGDQQQGSQITGQIGTDGGNEAGRRRPIGEVVGNFVRKSGWLGETGNKLSNRQIMWGSLAVLAAGAMLTRRAGSARKVRHSW